MNAWLASAVTWIAVGVAAYWWTTPELPPLVRDLPKEIAAADLEYRSRVGAKFPPGTSEAELIRELTAQRFAVTAHLATLKVQRFPCRVTWAVKWDAANGTVQNVEPSARHVCL